MISALYVPADHRVAATVVALRRRGHNALVEEVARLLGTEDVRPYPFALDLTVWTPTESLLQGARPNRRMTNARDAEVLLALGRRSSYAVAGDAVVVGRGPSEEVRDVPERFLADVDRAGWLALAKAG